MWAGLRDDRAFYKVQGLHLSVMALQGEMGCITWL